MQRVMSTAACVCACACVCVRACMSTGWRCCIYVTWTCLKKKRGLVVFFRYWMTALLHCLGTKERKTPVSSSMMCRQAACLGLCGLKMHKLKKTKKQKKNCRHPVFCYCPFRHRRKKKKHNNAVEWDIDWQCWNELPALDYHPFSFHRFLIK